MRTTLSRIVRTLGGLEVDQAAACARALTAMVGQMPAIELLDGGPTQLTRARLTARALAAWGPAPWPHGIRRQNDPADPAFLPPLGVHPVLAARDTTTLGMPGTSPKAWVDPDGWVGVDGGPAVLTAFGDDDGPWTLAERPPADGVAPVPDQARSDSRVGVRTRRVVRDVECVVMHFPVILDGRVAWVLHARATLADTAPAPRRLRVGVFIRPATIDGVRPIFRLERAVDGLWQADGGPVLVAATPADRVLSGRLATDNDPWTAFFSADPDTGLRPGRIDLRCPVGSASGAEVWHATVSPGESLSRAVVIGARQGTAEAVARTSATRLFAAANADRRGVLTAGVPLQFADPAGQPQGRVDALLDAVRVRLLTGAERGGLVGGISAVCLARLGFTRRAGDRIAAELERVDRRGRYSGSESEDAAVLAWAAGQYVMWTGDRAWLGEQQKPWSRLLDHLVSTDPTPGGRRLFGMNGSTVWTDTWGTAALLASAWVLRSHPRHRAWAMAGGQRREALRRTLGQGAWSASPDRAPDGASVGPLAAVWLGLIAPTHPGVAATLGAIRAHHWHGGGVLLQGGAHVAATCIHEAVRSLADPSHPALDALVALASPTGAFPTARHPARGALGQGDDPLSAALFGILALDRLRVETRRITLLDGILTARDLPTPFGRIDVVNPAQGRRIVGRWHGRPPEVAVL